MTRKEMEKLNGKTVRIVTWSNNVYVMVMAEAQEDGAWMEEGFTIPYEDIQSVSIPRP